jgi:hypothetical protein
MNRGERRRDQRESASNDRQVEKAKRPQDGKTFPLTKPRFGTKARRGGSRV